MSNKDKIKIFLVISALVSMMLGSAYAGYHYPEVYIQQFDPMGLRTTPGSVQKNITDSRTSETQYCTPKTIPFTRITTKYWCVA